MDREEILNQIGWVIGAVHKILYNPFERVHIAYLNEPYLSRILKGTKTMETRFKMNRSPPFFKVNDGDLILLKRSGGDIEGYARVVVAAYFENLTPAKFDDMLIKFGHQMQLDQKWIDKKRNSKYASLIKLADVNKFDTPIPFKQKGQESWITVELKDER